LLNRRGILCIASLLGGLAVLLGAFGAHALQLQSPQSEWYQTANQYHFLHSIALLIVPLLRLSKTWTKCIAAVWLIGILLFSGSLYLAAIEMLKWFWLTPIGGVLLLLGWIILAFAVAFNADDD